MIIEELIEEPYQAVATRDESDSKAGSKNEQEVAGGTQSPQSQ